MARFKSAIVPALAVGAAVLGFSKGLSSQDNSSAFYDLTTGNPNIDQDVLGTNAGVRELFMPIMPFNRFRVAQGGGWGFGTGGKGRLWAELQSGVLNSTNVTDYAKNNRQPLNSGLKYANSAPKVDGSIVFGQYNSRYGG